MERPNLIGSWKNTSLYPDAWAKPAVNWICSVLSVQGAHYAIRNCRKHGSGIALLSEKTIRCRLSRKNFKKEWRYNNRLWDKSRIVKNGLEAFVFLLAHETAHISQEGLSWYYSCLREKLDDKKFLKKSEYKIQEMAQAVLEQYRKSDGKKLLLIYKRSIKKNKVAIKKGCKVL